MIWLRSSVYMSYVALVSDQCETSQAGNKTRVLLYSHSLQHLQRAPCRGIVWPATYMFTVLWGAIIALIILCSLCFFAHLNGLKVIPTLPAFYCSLSLYTSLSLFLPLKYGSRPITFARFCFLILGVVPVPPTISPSA